VSKEWVRKEDADETTKWHGWLGRENLKNKPVKRENH
jgi:hypothetical protein